MPLQKLPTAVVVAGGSRSRGFGSESLVSRDRFAANEIVAFANKNGKDESKKHKRNKPHPSPLELAATMAPLGQTDGDVLSAAHCMLAGCTEVTAFFL